MGSIGNAIVYIINEGLSPVTTFRNGPDNLNKQTSDINNNYLSDIDVRITLTSLNDILNNEEFT